MALNITVHKNYLPTCQSPYTVRSENSEVIKFNRLVDLMAKEGTTLTKTDLLASMELEKDEVVKQLAEGKVVKTAMGSFFACASGTMDSVDQSFLVKDPTNNHELRVHFRPDRDFEQQVIDELIVVREETVDLGRPKIITVRPVGDGDSGAIRVGGMVEVRGLRLRFDPKTEAQGVFFIGEAGAAVRSAFYPVIMPASVLASVPGSLAAGTYAVAVRAAVNGKDVREGLIEGISVTVA